MKTNAELELKRKTAGLEEDKLFAEIAIRLNFNKHLSLHGLQIFSYAFTEMVNNAIEHSGASTVSIEANLRESRSQFTVIDKGIGLFENVRKKFKLQNHYEAIEHILKGKQTTMPEQHSGQGIFFTSRAADRFSIESHKLNLIVDNRVGDLFVKELPRKLTGTRVSFQISTRTRKDLRKLFEQYSGADYAFDKTEIKVRLSPAKGPYVSRSEAKRLVIGLEKFRRIVFDFQGVESIGQGFVDEIFRIFNAKFRQLNIEVVNACPAVQFMIDRARAEIG
ncbi:MAG: DUF4325 domain-containing protein [Deltaproteobacteria bacterium]|nr:DUF4325 domain-containing protein [Deltaproteobacteria bacterium]